jgi:hypothetical protein
MYPTQRRRGVKFFWQPAVSGVLNKIMNLRLVQSDKAAREKCMPEKQAKMDLFCEKFAIALTVFPSGLMMIQYHDLSGTLPHD